MFFVSFVILISPLKPASHRVLGSVGRELVLVALEVLPEELLTT